MIVTLTANPSADRAVVLSTPSSRARSSAPCRRGRMPGARASTSRASSRLPAPRPARSCRSAPTTPIASCSKTPASASTSSRWPVVPARTSPSPTRRRDDQAQPPRRRAERHRGRSPHGGCRRGGRRGDLARARRFAASRGPRVVLRRSRVRGPHAVGCRRSAHRRRCLGEALAAVVESARPDLIKPNHEELAELVGEDAADDVDVLAEAVRRATALVPGRVASALVTSAPMALCCSRPREPGADAPPDPGRQHGRRGRQLARRLSAGRSRRGLGPRPSRTQHRLRRRCRDPAGDAGPTPADLPAGPIAVSDFATPIATS